MIFSMAPQAPSVEHPRRRFTVDEVSRMAAQGILGEDEPIELLEGELLLVSPQDPLHAARVVALAARLTEAYRANANVHVRPQVPLDARPYSLPEPDLAVVKGRPLDYQKRHPVGAEALLVIEVANTSQALDHRKTRVYAAAGVPVYWLIDLAAQRVEVFCEPSAAGTFAQRHVLGPGDEAKLPGLEARVRVAELVA